MIRIAPGPGPGQGPKLLDEVGDPVGTQTHGRTDSLQRSRLPIGLTDEIEYFLRLVVGTVAALQSTPEQHVFEDARMPMRQTDSSLY